MNQTTRTNINELPSPGLPRRLAALFYDFLLVTALSMVISGIFIAFNDGEAVVGPALRVTLFITLFAFFSFFWRWGGQTGGMAAWRIRIVSLNGQPITLTQCLLRFLSAIASLICFGLGYIWVLFDKDKLTWHDRFSETKLVMMPKRKKTA